MIQLIGWTIIHSLWQIILIAGIYLLVKNTRVRQNALHLYYSSVGALLSAFLIPIITFCYLFKSKISTLTNTPLPTQLVDDISPTVILDFSESLPKEGPTFWDSIPVFFPYLVGFWAIGVLFFAGRFFISLFQINKLKNTPHELIKEEWVTKIQSFKNQLGIQKKVQVFLSTHVKEPITFGHFKPIILLPVSLMTGFEPAAIETIILHELAHIKRHDYLVNIGQSIIESFLFYHPLIWWLSKEVREIREHCCDDLVLSIGDNRAAYVQTLTALQWQKVGAGINRLSLSANGKTANFSRRIKRMFGAEEPGFSFRQLMGLFLLLLIPACGGALYQHYFLQDKEITSLSNEKEIEDTFIIDDKTKQEELEEWVAKVTAANIEFDFNGSTFYQNGHLKEVRGNYKSADKKGDFFATNLPCVNVLFKLIGDQLVGPEFLYPCKEKEKNAVGNYLIIDENTKQEDLAKWSAKLENNQIHFDYEKSVFDENGQLVEFKVNYEDAQNRGSFSATMPCAKFYYEMIGDYLIGPEFLKEEEIPKPYHLIPEGVHHLVDPTKSTFFISKGMKKRDLFGALNDFQVKTGASITFDYITFYLDQTLEGALSGTIRPNRDGQEIYSFEVHDLDKYGIQFTGDNHQLFPPKYIDNSTNQVITANKTKDAASSSLVVDKNTYKSDIAGWAKEILKHGVIFNYEKSIFDRNDRLVGLNGKFNSRCCYSDEFFHNVADLQIKLEVKDDHVFQPMVTRME